MLLDTLEVDELDGVGVAGSSLDDSSIALAGIESILLISEKISDTEEVAIAGVRLTLF